MAGRHQDCGELKVDRQTASLLLLSKEQKQKKKNQIKNCSAFQQGGEGQTQQETMHFNDYFSQLLEDQIQHIFKSHQYIKLLQERIYQTYKLWKYLILSWKSFSRANIKVSLWTGSYKWKKNSYVMEEELPLQGKRVSSQYYSNKKKQSF